MSVHIRQACQKLYRQESLSEIEISSTFDEMLAGNCNDVEIAAFLVALKLKGTSESEIVGAAKALRKNALIFDNHAVNAQQLSDCCGTGGDGLNTLNASTISSFVAASMGLKIVKHGNRSVSSSYGSADLIEDLGLRVDLSPEQSLALLDKCGWTFLFAPQYHASMNRVSQVRKELATRTIFNLLGPLANPANPAIQLLGVYTPELCEPFARVLNQLGVERALVVHGGGLDEITTHSTTHAVELRHGAITRFELTPAELGVSSNQLPSIQLTSSSENLTSAKRVIDGSGPAAHINLVSVNVGALLYLNDYVDSLHDGAMAAKAHIESGQVSAHVLKIQKATEEML